ncbi:MAG: dienelactone hydrolase family protein [Xanthomonadales bacterium]|nr:dienelactone hydrolase family protein [Gammaproteobacteria bacterium]MBT8054538.1 dienelactone hydrolase family protein [Gammaproteobacteria bacterium]NNK52349.1 dienelactone hydrolase family protein [Xanthomonadales bacterium]
MCDERTEKDIDRLLRRRGMTRRDFNTALSVAALAALLPSVANAYEVVESEVMVRTPDGEADCYLVHPAEGRHAAVIMWPDIKGIRPAFRMMGKRLAQSGYTVLVINPYYRTARGEVIEPGESFGDPEVRARLMPHARSLSPETCVSDGGAFIEYLDAHQAVDPGRQIGTAGYCMTGSYTFRLAAAYPERIGAGASFHGGGLATEKADSPHLLVPEVDAGFLIAIAENDDEKDPEDKTLLRAAFDQAGKSAEIEVYEGTLHGWCPPDGDAHNQVQADRAWERMLALFERELA